MKVSKYRNSIFRDFIGCLISKLTHNGSRLCEVPAAFASAEALAEVNIKKVGHFA
jgi:hypothetical protein